MINRHTRQQAPKLAEPLRVRNEPPTMEEAVRAAQDLSSDQEQQVEIAAGLMGVSHDEVRQQFRHVAARPVTPRPLMNGRAQVVVVERRAQRPALTRPGRP